MNAARLKRDFDEGRARWVGSNASVSTVAAVSRGPHRHLVTCRGHSLTEDDFAFLAQNGAAAKAWAVPAGMPLHEMEKLLITATIHSTGGNIKEAAAQLGIDRSTLYEKIKRYEIPR